MLASRKSSATCPEMAIDCCSEAKEQTMRKRVTDRGKGAEKWGIARNNSCLCSRLNFILKKKMHRCVFMFRQSSECYSCKAIHSSDVKKG